MKLHGKLLHWHAKDTKHWVTALDATERGKMYAHLRPCQLSEREETVHVDCLWIFSFEYTRNYDVIQKSDNHDTEETHGKPDSDKPLQQYRAIPRPIGESPIAQYISQNEIVAVTEYTDRSTILLRSGHKITIQGRWRDATETIETGEHT